MSEYSAKLRHPMWQKKRLEILSRDEFRCRLCGEDQNTLHVHHLRYEKGADPWDYNDSSLVTVCEGCHEELHVSKVGESILESLIVGGADLDALYSFQSAIELTFSDGPYAARVAAGRWPEVIGAIAYALDAVQRGASGSEVGDALKGLARG